LTARNIDLGRAGAIRLFAADTPAGARAELTALDDGWLVVAAPGLPMAPEAQDTATQVTLLVSGPSRGWSATMTCPTRWPTRSWTCG
jgi:aminomethyltransferase